LSSGKHLSLEEARKAGKMDRFCKEHPSEGDEAVFDQLFEAMANGEPPKKPSKVSRTSSQADDAC
jgi:hypothetical protein